MDNIDSWSLKWGIPQEAIKELKASMGITENINTKSNVSEAAVLAKARLDASKLLGRLWRNNVGACFDEHGNFFRYGLANDSKKLNTALKSSDLIGIKPVLIEQKHVGQTVGIFVARETKPENWNYKGSAREKAQLKFIELINSLGGDAAFHTGAYPVW